MLQGKRSFVLLFSRSALLFAAVLLLLLQMGVEAQCGTQASSCKSCHEVQAELPVNADGTGWHESHAFGDFCYICHAGNQQATELEAAHQGLVDPLSDLDASCKMCHAADLTERAQVYATTLNIELGSGSAPTEPTGEPAAEDFWGSEPSATTVPAAAGAAEGASDDDATAVCPPTGTELTIDDASFVNYVERYDEIVLGKTPTNWGNVTLVALIGLLVVGGGTFVIWNEIRTFAAREETKKAEGEYPAEVVEMLPALSALNPQPRRALRKILENPQKTDKVLGLIDTVLADDETEEPRK
ncbi:MAG: hypothetical protein IPK52_15430 [Chloroflexi bacterium]|nr:hypothetical protein [Chloroflexota bacterium]